LIEMGRLRGFAGVSALALAVSGCGASHGSGGQAPRTTRASVVSPVAVTPTIARVKAAWPLFDSFPNRSGAAKRCLLPGPGISRGIRAWCSTKVDVRTSPDEVVVGFEERWPWREFRYSGSPRRKQHHSWLFVVRSRGHVEQAGQSGDFPPQSAE
jgi:hypothetical protein